MAVPLSGRRIFLASPSGLDDERDLVQREIAAYNDLHGYAQGVAFVVVRWETLPGGVGRPQARINPFIVESDYLIMLVSDHLGSATTPTPPYQTGIEEELATAAAALADPDSPMVDLLLLFRAPDVQALLEPTDKLKQVQSFRHDIESTKELSYHQFTTDEELRRKLLIQLVEWARPLGPKVPQSYPRILAALDRTERYSMASPPSDRPDNLIEWAEAQADQGLVTIADSAFAKAVTHEQPEHLLRYARFLQRTGQLARAFELDQRVLSLDSVVGSDAPEAVGHRTRALANMGLVKRKQGDLAASRRHLAEAVAAGRQRSNQVAGALGYALDQLGITEARVGDLDAADRAYREALEVRHGVNDRAGEAQSLVNIARIARQRGNTKDAVEQLERAVELLEQGDGGRTLANALAGLGQALIETDPARARTLLDRALAVNERLQIPDGISVTSNVLALLCLSAGDTAGASAHARRVLDLSNETGNREGMAVALRLLGQIQCATGEWSDAIAVLEEAVAIAIDQRDRAREGAARLWLAQARRGFGDVDGALDEARVGLDAATTATDKQTEEALRSLMDDLGG